MGRQLLRAGEGMTDAETCRAAARALSFRVVATGGHRELVEGEASAGRWRGPRPSSAGLAPTIPTRIRSGNLIASSFYIPLGMKLG